MANAFVAENWLNERKCLHLSELETKEKRVGSCIRLTAWFVFLHWVCLSRDVTLLGKHAATNGRACTSDANFHIGEMKWDQIGVCVQGTNSQKQPNR